MRAVSHYWALLIVVPALVVACDGGGSSSGSPTKDDEDDACRFTSTVSGGLQASFTGASAVCAYSSRSVSLTEIGGEGVVLLIDFDDVKALETGTFPANIEVRKKPDTWAGAKCSIVIESNVKVSGSDAGASSGAFDNYLIKGTGSCSSPAVYRGGDGGSKDPVTIAPFTFSLLTLFY